MRCKRPNIDHVNQICFPRNNFDLKALSIVHEGGLWHGFCAGGALDVDKLLDQLRYGPMIPIGEGENDLIIVVALVRVMGIMNNDWISEAFGVLPIIVRVVPIRSSLLGLFK